MKNDLPFFSHDNNASQHPKMKALIAEYGYAGYGMFWALNEKIARSEGACIDISRKVYKLDLANELRMDNEGLDKFLNFLSDPEIDLLNIKNGVITTDRINELYKKVIESREKERERKSKKGKPENPERSNSFPDGKRENIGGSKDFPGGRQKNTGGKNDRIEENKEYQKKQNKIMSDAEKLFLTYWQEYPDIFNVTAGFDSYEKWRKFWDTSPPTSVKVKTAFENFIADIKCGDIERRYIPSKPDLFISANYLNTCQERRKKIKHEHRITADKITSVELEKMIKRQ